VGAVSPALSKPFCIQLVSEGKFRLSEWAGGFFMSITNQLGRRNLSPVDFKLALGRRYNRTKKAQGGDHGNQHVAKDQNDPLPNTAAKLATQHGVSEATVKRAGKLAEAVEARPEIKDAIANVSEGTIAKVKTIKAKASEETKVKKNITEIRKKS
jgi:hypothetical protein